MDDATSTDAEEEIDFDSEMILSALGNSVDFGSDVTVIGAVSGRLISPFFPTSEVKSAVGLFLAVL